MFSDVYGLCYDDVHLESCRASLHLSSTRVRTRPLLSDPRHSRRRQTPSVDMKHLETFNAWACGSTWHHSFLAGVDPMSPPASSLSRGFSLSRCSAVRDFQRIPSHATGSLAMPPDLVCRSLTAFHVEMFSRCRRHLQVYNRNPTPRPQY